MRTEELLTRVRAAAGGAEPMPDMAPIIETVELTTQQTLRQFLADAESDVGMPPLTREKIAGALHEYLGGLARMRQASLSENPRALSQSVDEAERNVNMVRAAQTEHYTSLAQGATVFPYLNRLLTQYTMARAGADRQPLLALLKDSPNFVQWLRFELAARQHSPLAAQPIDHLQKLLETVLASLPSGGQLPDIQQELMELAPRLAGMLEEPIRPGAEKGPTPIPAVNRVFQALESCTGADEEVDFLLTVISQCRTSLRSVVPPGSMLMVMRRLNFVLNSLDKMEHCLRERTGFDDLVAVAGQLEASANTLASTLAASAPQPTAPRPIPPSPKTQGMPAIFRSVLDPGYALIEGVCDAETVRAAAQHLDGAAGKMQEETAQFPQGGARLEAIHEGLQLMRQAAEALRGLAASSNANLLEVARGQCRQAIERLEVAGVVKI